MVPVMVGPYLDSVVGLLETPAQILPFYPWGDHWSPTKPLALMASIYRVCDVTHKGGKRKAIEEHNRKMARFKCKECSAALGTEQKLRVVRRETVFWCDIAHTII